MLPICIILHFTATCFSHHIMPSSGSLYKITSRTQTHKHTMLHIWNEINSGIPQFSTTHDNITVKFFIIQTNKYTEQYFIYCK
jgi:hypothetical protein